MSSGASRTLHVGNVPGDIRKREVADLFYKYGRIVDIDLKIPPRPPGHCFIEYARDAEDAIRDAIRGRDGYNFDGNRLRVELARGGRGQSSTNNGDSSRASQTLCVGNLPGDIRKREVEDLFYKYGRIVDVDLKIPPGPPGHCFIEFEDARDAEEAIRDRNGYNFDGNRLRVELARDGRGQSSNNDGDSSRASQTLTLSVGNLPGDIMKREVEDLFYKYGRIVDIDLKIPPGPPGHCFIEFEDARDAEDAIRDAIRGRDGYNFDGNRLRVELASGGRGQSSTNDGDSSRASQTLCVGNLPCDIKKREVEGLFDEYGRIVHIDLKIPPGPPGHCFIEFEDAPDAEDAIRDRDGYNFDGNRLRVELARGGRGQSSTNDGDISTDSPSSSGKGSLVGPSLTPSPPRQGSSEGSSLTPSPPRQGSSSTAESPPNVYDESVPVNPDDGSVPVNVPVNPDDGSVPVNVPVNPDDGSAPVNVPVNPSILV